MKLIYGLIPGLLIAGMLLGCQNASGDHYPRIRYGKDVCKQCRMIISEAPYAAALITQDGSAYKFDGIGCLLKYMTDHPEEKGKFWVHAFDSGAWLDARNAFFVHDKEMKTPMGDGWVAFGERQAAESWAWRIKENVIIFDQLFEKPIKGGA